MDLYRIGTENGVKVYKKTKLGDIAFIIICSLLSLSGVFFGTTCYYRSKYEEMENLLNSFGNYDSDIRDNNSSDYLVVGE